MFGRGKRARVAVIGLDGSPYTLIKKLTENGVMPNLNSLIREGNFYQMDTTIPEISSVAWSTFMTGKNSGEHGIFGFTELVPRTYKLRFPNSSDLKYPPIWDDLKKVGKRTVVINLPSTYPAKPMSGVLIAGFVALRIEKASYPEEIIPYLKSINYRIDVDTLRARENKDFLIKDLFETLEIRRQAMLHFLEKEKWDLFIGVITGTDRLQHFMMDAFFDETNKYHQSFLDYYNLVDSKIIKEIRERIDDCIKLIVLSDHGFTKIDKEVYLNRWLVEEGYLRFKNEQPESIEDIAEGSRAFVMDPGRIYINLKGKYPFGSVSNGDEHKELIDELKEKLDKVEYKGKKVIKRILKRDEIYTGPYAENGPDLVAQSNYGFDLKGTVKSKEVFGNSFLTGMHTQDDAFVILPEEKNVEQKPHISQLKDMILGLLK